MARREGGFLAVRVVPRAGRDQVVGWQGSALRIKVAAAPEAGRANHAVIGLLADALGVSRSSIELVKGAAARDKLFRIAEHSADELRARLGGGVR
ncbi:MAG: DUF167 domain-containing protein [Candidatus Rokuibacteriota bacterium]|nr:MAG: DUF167 domain-containing protein [Candidatus Rokubacteria bacterium]